MKELEAKIKLIVISLIFLIGVIVIPGNTEVQEFPLKQFVGSWHGSGKLFGKEARFEMKWARVLNKQFVRLSFQNSYRGKDSQEILFNAEAFYRSIGNGKLVGTWFDSRGKTISIDAEISHSVLTVLWSDSGTEEGRTLYKVVSSDSIEVNDFILRDGEWQQFGSAVYTRVDQF